MAFFTLQGMDEAVANLNLKPDTLKGRLLSLIRSSFTSEESLQTLTSIPAEDLILELWQVDDPDQIRQKKKNLSSLKSAINKSLKKLAQEGKNPEGLIISKDNVFAISDEHKNDMLQKLGIMGGDSAQELISSFGNLLKGLTSGGDKETASALLQELDKARELIASQAGLPSQSHPTLQDEKGHEQGETSGGDGEGELSPPAQVEGKDKNGSGPGDVGEFSGEKLEKRGAEENFGLAETELQGKRAETFDETTKGYGGDTNVGERADENVEGVEEIDEEISDQTEEIEEVEIDEDETEIVEVDEDELSAKRDDGEQVGEAGEEDWLGEGTEEEISGQTEETEEIEIDEDETEIVEVDEDESSTQGDDGEKIGEAGEEDWLGDETEEEISGQTEKTEEVEIDEDETEIVEVDEDELITQGNDGEQVGEAGEEDWLGEGAEEVEIDEDETEVVEVDEDEFSAQGDDGEQVPDAGEEDWLGEGAEEEISGQAEETEEIEIDEDETEIVEVDEDELIAQGDGGEQDGDAGEEDWLGEGAEEEISGQAEETEEVEIDEDETEIVEVDEDELIAQGDGGEQAGDAGEEDWLEEGADEEISGQTEEIDEVEIDEDETEIVEVDEDEIIVQGDEVEEIEIDEDELDEIIEVDEDDIVEQEIAGETTEADGSGSETKATSQPMDISHYIEPSEALADLPETLEETQDDYLNQILERFMPKFIKIPSGHYPIGSKHPNYGERLLKKIPLKAFYISQLPVTNDLYDFFVRETGYETDAEKAGFGTVVEGRICKRSDPLTGRTIIAINPGTRSSRVQGASWRHPAGAGSSLENKANHPVVQVSRNDAMAFAAWAGKRLPSEDEWEAAARGQESFLFPWGNEWIGELANFESSHIGDTTPVTRHGKSSMSPFGLLDLLGNVFEWTATIHTSSRPGAENLPPIYILKGGSWSSKKGITAASRILEKNTWSNIIGFRCAV